MSSEAWLWLTVVLVGATVLMVHLLTVWNVFFRTDLRWPTRLVALVPPGAPIVAWLGGLRTLPILWGLSLMAYTILWVAL